MFLESKLSWGEKGSVGMRSLFLVLVLVWSGFCLSSFASEAKPATPDAPYALLAHENGSVFRLSRKTGHVWMQVQSGWKLIPTNTAFQLRDIAGSYPLQFQLVGTKIALVLMNSNDGKSQYLSLGPDPASYRFVDMPEPTQ